MTKSIRPEDYPALNLIHQELFDIGRQHTGWTMLTETIWLSMPDAAKDRWRIRAAANRIDAGQAIGKTCIEPDDASHDQPQITT